MITMGSHVAWIGILLLALSPPTVTGFLTEKRSCVGPMCVWRGGGGVQQSNNCVNPGMFDKGPGRGHYCHISVPPLSVEIVFKKSTTSTLKYVNS